MEFRGNIIFSAVMHAAVFTAALALAGNDLALHLPERYVPITLLEDASEKKTVMRGAEEKKKPANQTGKPVNGLPEAASPEVPLKTEEAARPSPASVPPKNDPHPDNANNVKSPVSSGRMMALTGQGAGVSGTSQGSLQVAIPGSGSAQQSSSHGKNKTVGGDDGEVGAIKAAIERAKSYPLFARKRGIEGTVTAEFTINAKGYPENIRIVQSSGYEILDSAARKTLVAASPFPQVKGTLEVPITFRIDRRN